MTIPLPRLRRILAATAALVCLPPVVYAQTVVTPNPAVVQQPQYPRQRGGRRNRQNSGQNNGQGNAQSQQNPNFNQRQNTRRTPTGPPIELVPGGTISSAPIVGKNGLVYLASWNSCVYALDSATGKLKWKFTAAKMFNSSPVIGPEGTVYAGAYDGNIYALDGDSGNKKWQFATRALVNESPAVSSSGDMVYVGGYDRTVYALSADNGALKWHTPVGAAVSAPAVGAHGTVYVGADKIYALKPDDGKPKWQSLTGYDAASPVTLNGDGNVYAQVQDSTGRSQVCALDTATGKKAWAFSLSDSLTAPVSASNDRVYVGSDYLYALRQGSGQMVWRHGDGNIRWSTPSVDNGIVCAGSDNGSVVALDATTGAPLWSFATNDPLISFPRFGPGGIVYVSCEGDRKTYALNGRTGKVLWQFTQDPVPTPPAPKPTTRRRGRR